MFWKSTGNDRVASSNSCNEQCTKVSSRSSTKVNPGLLRVFKGKAGCRDLISGVKGGKCLMKWYGSNATSHWSCCCAWKIIYCRNHQNHKYLNQRHIYRHINKTNGKYVSNDISNWSCCYAWKKNLGFRQLKNFIMLCPIESTLIWSGPSYTNHHSKNNKKQKKLTKKCLHLISSILQTV